MVSQNGQSLIRVLNGIEVEQRITDGFINATALANAYEQGSGIRKDVRNWTTTERTKSYIYYLSAKTGFPVSDLIQVKRGGKNAGTWIHPKLAVSFATWLSVEFEFQVSEWVEEWMTTGQNPIQQHGSDRIYNRLRLKDDARLAMTDEVKKYLESIQKYDNKWYRGKYFADLHDALNIGITGETAEEMRKRIGKMIGRPVKETELIRDYFPADVLQSYIAVCHNAANFMLRDRLEPMKALEKALIYGLPPRFKPKMIEFEQHINQTQQKLLK